MIVSPDQVARLRFLQRVVRRESELLQETTAALFDADAAKGGGRGTGAPVWALPAGSLPSALSERLDAFVARFARLQDSLGDKLLPALLVALAEPVGAALDNLNVGERVGWFDSVEYWRSIRALRNQMIHDDVEDRRVLEGALCAARDAVPMLCAVPPECRTRLIGVCRSHSSSERLFQRAVQHQHLLEIIAICGLARRIANSQDKRFYRVKRETNRALAEKLLHAHVIPLSKVTVAV